MTHSPPEEDYRILVQNVQDCAIFMVDLVGRILTWNVGAERLTGYSACDVIGQHIAYLYTPEDCALNKPEQSFIAAQKKEYYLTEGWQRRKDHSIFWAHITTTPLRNSHGELFAFATLTRDITEPSHTATQFQLAIEAAPTGMILVNSQGIIVLVNSQVERLFHYTREALIGHPVEMLVPERYREQHPNFRHGFFNNPKTRPMGAGRDLYGLRQDGTEVPIEIGLNPLRTPEGDFVLSSVVDITERKRAEQERERLLESICAQAGKLSATLKERDVLLQEIHHRVKNNLQVISSLINMQRRLLEEPKSRDALEECRSRVQAIALIHEMLYQSKDYSRIPFSEYAQSLASQVFYATGGTLGKVELELAVEAVSLAVDKAIPCGLVLNELIINALKHAFPNERQGKIRIELVSLPPGQLQLSVTDNGIGLPADINIRQSHSLGMQLIATLADQLEAQITTSNQNGARFQLTFSVDSQSINAGTPLE